MRQSIVGLSLDDFNPCLPTAGYQSKMWLDLENPSGNTCSSATSCDGKLVTGGGVYVPTATHIDNTRIDFDFSAANSGAMSCAILNSVTTFEAADCNDLNYAFCEVSCPHLGKCLQCSNRQFLYNNKFFWQAHAPQSMSTLRRLMDPGTTTPVP